MLLKLIKKLVKVAATIIGAYLAFNTFILAKIGMSRIARQMRLTYPDRKLPDNVWEMITDIDTAVLEEADDEWEAWKQYVSGNNN